MRSERGRERGGGTGSLCEGGREGRWEEGREGKREEEIYYDL